MSSTSLSAAGFQVDDGDVFDLATGTLDLGCADFVLNSGAILNAGSGEIHLSGDWHNFGEFNPGTSRVVFNDDCGIASVSSLLGETRFYDFVASTTLGRELQFESGQSQSVDNSLVLTGTTGDLLKIRSTVTGNPGFLVLDAVGNQTIDYVDVQDNHANTPGQHLAVGRPEEFHSIDGGGNLRWFLNGLHATSVPVLPLSGLVLLALLVFLVSRFERRLLRRRR